MGLAIHWSVFYLAIKKERPLLILTLTLYKKFKTTSTTFSIVKHLPQPLTVALNVTLKVT